MDYRKRPRTDEHHPSTSNSQPQSTLTTIPSSSSTSSSSTSPTIKLLQTELRTLRAELDHSQSIRSIERKNADRSETRLKRQLADTYEEITQSQELSESLREQVDRHGQTMKESRREWLERIQWYEEQWEEMANQNNGGGGGFGEDDADRHRCDLLQKRLDAAMDQVGELEQSLEEGEERRVAAEERAADAEVKSVETKRSIVADDENTEIPRDLRIKVAETERANRELQRQNDSMKSRVQEMIQHKERAASSQRRVHHLEKEVQHLTRQMEEGKETQRRWKQFRSDIVEEGLVGENDEMMTLDETSSVPPEIATVVRKFQTLKRNAKQQEDEIARVTQLSEAHLRRCKVLETQLNEKSQSVTMLEKKVNDQENTINQLELENRKIVAQQNIWKRESEGMRSLLDTYEQQETSQSKSPMSKRANADGLQLSLNSAREEVKLLSETNEKLEATIEELRTEQETSKAEHERVLEKFHKIRNALMEERAKAETAEARACQAETLAGTGSYNSETTRVVHLKSNPLTDAMREKYQLEIDSLKRRLEEAEASVSTQGGGTTTPDASKSRGSFGSAGSRDSVDVQKLHSRLKEQFRNQIALFRQGVYLITGFKIDMSQGENDCQLFTIRSLYGEREEDHMVFKWSPKKKNKLDILNTDMAHLLMKGPSGVYVTEHGSWPGFMASVTLQLFDQQTVL
eukprot:CAMPEP_0172309292 /NCGR_PEP_ID=MMETSP1058-20130122/9629_1 /TAXON_ID=83371 /ORGANISM="Detonula confervacea, Strain CCMP 353" /LENGTH=689 /DNA_ID=CAMNT_0013021889 /DNA_START=73 /DNA_END=2142 /DNA_ORIENTATION=+